MRLECPKCKSVHWIDEKDVQSTQGDFIYRCRECEQNITIHKPSRNQDTSIGALRARKDFTGSLSVMGVPDVIQMCHLGLKTGMLRLSSPRGGIRIYFDAGNITYAVPDLEKDGVAYFLFRNGRIDMGQLSKVVKTSQSEGILQEKALYKVLSWKEGEFQIVLDSFMTETVTNTFPWTSGEFSFTEAARMQDAPGELVVDTTNLILEGIRLIKEWDLIRRTIPDDQTVLQIRAEAARKLERTHLLHDEREVLSLIDGKRSAGEICSHAPCAEFVACRAMYGFLAAGLARKINVKNLKESKERPEKEPKTHGTRYRIARKDKGSISQAIPVGSRTIVFGRSLSADVYVGNDRASRRHCQVMSREGKLIVRDLGSTNGTFLNGRRVFREHLSPGDVISIGDMEFVVEG